MKKRQKTRKKQLKNSTIGTDFTNRSIHYLQQKGKSGLKTPITRVHFDN